MLRSLLGGFSRREADRLIEAGKRAESEAKTREACELYRRALGVRPGYARAHLHLGVALEAMGEGDAALQSYRDALAAEPSNPFASYNLGKLLHLRGEHAAAASHLRAALERKRDFTDARVVLASALEAAGDADAALQALEPALRERPGDAGAWHNYALLLQTLRERGDLERAAASLTRALELRSDWAEAWVVYAELLKILQRLPESEAAARRAVSLAPRLPAAYRVLGAVLVDQLRVEEALQVYAAGRQLDPDGEVETAELFVLNFHDGITGEALFERHKAFGERYERSHPPRFLRYANSRDPEKPLRIGYLSGDFRAHPVGFAFLPLVERHDRAACEAYCYSVYKAADRFTRRIAERADRWRDVAGLPAAEVGDIIHRDGVDVLMDLSGYGGIPVFQVMAQRPAPVQASWLGYLSTSGLACIDYRITDAFADPPGVAERFHTETLLRLPHSQWCYREAVPVDAPQAPPSAANGFVTFGAFNQSAKISPTARRLWAEILKRTPGSRLLVVGVPAGPATQLVLDDFARHGVPPGAVSVTPRVPFEDYFRTIGNVDIALDTTPYSGGTTTCDTLWMGTPVLTLTGARSLSRSASSALGVLGLQDWIAATPEEYVAKAVAAATDPGALAALRATLREKMRASPLMDEARFARDMEALYRRMWRSWCAKLAR